MGCNGGREFTFLKWRVVRAAPLNPTVRRCCNARPRPESTSESTLVEHWFVHVRYNDIRPNSFGLSPLGHDELSRCTAAAKTTFYNFQLFTGRSVIGGVTRH
ncbi:hypothetical protein Pla100_37420 [Neorhodopirellula pilleata]|uniref:Uncharacterized protein n=1 Tax=Neorhodopirellula pilleata TaxID=2714738 RepID=A0A5C6A790_9BACT|nr:hypothetical protein Pla100_37420 [Neorhodopirellula pilleata]